MSETAQLAVRDQEANTKELAGKYLTFQLGNEHFGIQVLQVREIVGLMPVSLIPGTPSHIRGVLNLRGNIIPVMELRKRLNLEDVEDHNRNCIIVTEVVKQDRTVDMGILVDSVSEVFNIQADEIEPPPEFGTQVDTSFILGVAKSGSDVRILLNIDEIVLTDAVEMQDATTNCTG